MRRLFVLLCVCAGMTMLAGVPVDRSRVVKSSQIERTSIQRAPVLSAGNVAGARICLMHLWDWSEDAMGHVSVSANDPFYGGGWTTTVVAGAGAGEMVFAGGLAMCDVDVPFTVNGTTVTLKVGDEPFATVSGSKTTTAGGVTTTVDSTLYYYVVNEDWLVNYGDLADVHGTVLDDGTIVFNEGFAYYIEHEVTTTVTAGGKTQTFNDSSFEISLLIRDLQLLVPNGVHEFTDQNGQIHSVDVVLRQSNDTVYVTNLWGMGWQEDYMLLAEGGVMTFPGQAFADISDAENPGGAGLWYNGDGNGSLGNAGAATPEMITWDLTVPTDNATTWPAWTANKLYFTNGSTFVVPASQHAMRGDVDGNEDVNMDDLTVLINYLLTGDASQVVLENAAVCDSLDSTEVSMDDLTALINYLLTGQWPD